MNLQLFRNTWNGVKDENRFFRILAVGQTIALIVALVILMTKDEKVVLTPPALPEKMTVTKSGASSGYKKSWALYVATLVGNVDAGNADFVIEQLITMMRPDVQHAFKSALAQQLDVIKRNQISITYEATQVYFEKETDKIFVIGKSAISGAAGRSNKVHRVFEMEMQVDDYAPVITLLETYEGEPRTIAWHEKQEQRAERDAARKQQD